MLKQRRRRSIASPVSTTNNDRSALVSRRVVGGIFVVFTVGHGVEVFGGSARDFTDTASLLARDSAAATLVAWVVLTVAMNVRTGVELADGGWRLT